MKPGQDLVGCEVNWKSISCLFRRPCWRNANTKSNVATLSRRLTILLFWQHPPPPPGWGVAMAPPAASKVRFQSIHKAWTWQTFVTLLRTPLLFKSTNLLYRLLKSRFLQWDPQKSEKRQNYSKTSLARCNDKRGKKYTNYQRTQSTLKFIVVLASKMIANIFCCVWWAKSKPLWTHPYKH